MVGLASEYLIARCKSFMKIGNENMKPWEIPNLTSAKFDL